MVQSFLLHPTQPWKTPVETVLCVRERDPVCVSVANALFANKHSSKDVSFVFKYTGVCILGLLCMYTSVSVERLCFRGCSVDPGLAIAVCTHGGPVFPWLSCASMSVSVQPRFLVQKLLSWPNTVG